MYYMKIIKSDNDNKEYKYGVLQNGIKVLYINDNLQTHSYLCLTINIGSYSDPEEYLGMAHFTEHMILTGSRRFSKPNYFTEFINKHGGDYNAHTTNTFTSYYFSIRTEYFEKALIIFSSFLVDPLFSKDIYLSEINSVDAEHTKNLFIDNFIVIDMLKHLVNKSNPYYKFTTGNKATLGKKGTYNSLIDFYNKYYSSNLMKIVVLSNNSIQFLEDIISKYYTKIVNKGLTMEYDYKNILNINSNKRYIQVYSQMKILALSWEVPYDKKYGIIARKYIMKYISNSSQNSLLYHLKQLGLITGYINNYDDNPGIITIGFNITSKGYYLIPTIIQQTMKYLKLLEKHCCVEWRYNEVKSNIINKFNTKFDVDIYAVCEIAEYIGESNVEDILLDIYSYPDFERVESLIKDYLTSLQDSPFTVIISNDRGENFPDIDSNYGVHYKISENLEKHFGKVNIKLYFELIKKNNKILKTVKFSNYKSYSYPKKIYSKANMFNLYFKNVQNDLPIKFICLFKNNYAIYTPYKKFTFLLYSTIISYRIGNKLGKLADAGISYDISKSHDDFQIIIESYNENMIYAINKLSKIIKDKITKSEINNAANILKSKLITSADDVIAERAFIISKLNTEFYPIQIENIDIMQYFDKIDEIDIKKFNDDKDSMIFKNSFLNSIIYGNCYPSNAIKYFKKFIEFIKDSSNEYYSLKTLDTDIQYFYNHINKMANNNIYCVSYYSFRGFKKEPILLLRKMLYTQLITMILSKKFSYNMRNKNMFGYINYVKTKSYNTMDEKVMVIYLYVQSPSHSPNTVEPFVTKFINKTFKNIVNMKQEELDKYKGTIISNIDNFKKDDEIGFYYSCLSDNLPFNYINEASAIIKKLTVSDVSEFYESIFLNKYNYKVEYKYTK